MPETPINELAEPVAIGQVESIPFIEVVWDDAVDEVQLIYLAPGKKSLSLPTRQSYGRVQIGEPSKSKPELDPQHLLPHRQVKGGIKQKELTVAAADFWGVQDWIGKKERLQVRLPPGNPVEVEGTRVPVFMHGTAGSITVRDATSVLVHVNAGGSDKISISTTELAQVLVSGPAAVAFESVDEADLVVLNGSQTGFARFTGCRFVRANCKATPVNVANADCVSVVTNGGCEVLLENVRHLRTQGRELDRVEIYGDTELFVSSGKERLQLQGEYSIVVVGSARYVDAYNATIRSALKIAGTTGIEEPTVFRGCGNAQLMHPPAVPEVHRFAGSWMRVGMEGSYLMDRMVEGLFRESMAECPSMKCAPLIEPPLRGL